MLRLVFGYRKEHDELRHKAQDKAEKLAMLKNELALSEQTAAESTGQNNEKTNRLEALKMQLNTVTIKIGETGENRKNYDLSRLHLKEEDFDHFNQLKVLRRQLTDTNTFFKKMNDLRLQRYVRVRACV
jgi:chromosome segregation ATPase